MTLDQWRALRPEERLDLCEARERAAQKCFLAARGLLAEAVAHRRLCRWRQRWLLIVKGECASAQNKARWVEYDTTDIRRALGVTSFDLLVGWLRRRVG